MEKNEKNGITSRMSDSIENKSKNENKYLISQ